MRHNDDQHACQGAPHPQEFRIGNLLQENTLQEETILLTQICDNECYVFDTIDLQCAMSDFTNIFRTMSDVVERIMYECGTTSYRVKVNQFHNKMNQWKPERSLQLKSFVAHDDRTQFHLEVFPNGREDKHRGHVSIFLISDSDKSVRCSYELRIGGQTKCAEDVNFLPNDAWGSDEIFSHFDFFCRSWKRDTVDERLEIFCKISKLWTESDDPVFKSSQKIANDKSSYEPGKTCEKIDVLLDSFNELHNKVSSLEKKLDLQKKENDEIKLKVTNKLIPSLLCPACFEPLNRSPKIAQCVFGHLLCWNC